MSSSTRATRSRFSSPAQAQPKNKSLLPLEPSATKGNEASKTFMDRWLEPSVQTKTSFEEAGLARFGVLENMAPLGSLPKARMFTGEAGSAIRKIILKTGAARAKEELDRASSKRSSRSPAGSPPPAKRAARETSSQEPAADDSGADVPRETTERTRRRLSRRAAAAQDDGAGDESFTSSVKLEVGTPDLAEASAAEDKTVVGVVGDEAGHHNAEGWPLSSIDGELPEALAQAADAETMNAFNQQMQQITQEGSRDNKGCYYFVPPSEDDRSAAPAKSKSASLSNHDDDGSSEADTRAAKKAKTSHGLGATTEAAKTRLFGSTTTKATDEQDDEGITATAQRDSAPAKNRKRRRDSESSGASLSSVANAADLESLDSPLARLSSPSPAARPAAATSTGASKASASDAPDRRTGNSRSRTTKTRSSEANSLSLNTSITANVASPSTNSPRTAHGNMPGRLAASELLSLQGSGPEGAVNDEPPSSPVHHEEDETVWNRRREAQKVTNNYRASESAVRRGEKRSRPSTPVRSSRRTRQSTGAPASTRATRSAVKKPGDDAEGMSSSVAPSLLADESSLADSRAVTPTKKPKSGLRVKSSPVKKQQGSAAGLPRPADAPVPSNGSTTPKDSTADNDEYCSACGSDGDVVCCDGCPRSFHFECVDMVRSDDLPDEWFCNECIVRRFPSRVPIHRGIFAGALNNLEKSIPRAFALPKKVQNRFEGVKAGPGGEYEEVNAAAKGPAKKRNGYDELPDLHKQREDGQAVLCHSCQKASTEKRAILPCSACPLHWHMDCMDPPLAVPPLLKTWKCPAHVDDVLADAPVLAPAHKYRRVKNAQVIAPIFTRGMKNNGHIEIDWSDEPEPLKEAGWPDPRSFGRTYKVSANSVVLDFIEQLRRQGAGYAQREDEPRIVPTSSVPLEAQQDRSKPVLGSALGRTVDEMQAGLNLIGLKRRRNDGIDYLTSALLSQADESVVALMARGSADNFASGHLSDDDRTGLRAMLAQMDAMSSRIRDLLGDKAQSPTVPTPIPGAATPPAEPSSSAPKQDGEVNNQHIAEPTPPSTVDHAETNMELD